jgi:pimeloyl-ACP methyl ester carboxylesterase
MFAEINGIQMHWEEFGEGEPLLWLQGLMGAGADWQYIFNEPPSGYRLITPDLRGHGASTNPAGAFSFRQCSQDVLVLLQHLGIDRCKAIGLSGGGITLLHMATTAPSRIEKMVLVSAVPYFPAQTRQAMRHLSATILGADEMSRMRSRHKYGEAQIEQLFTIAHRMAETYDDVNFTPPYLGTITAKTLIVFGDRDPLYPVSIAFELQQAIPQSLLWIVPNGGHGPIFGDDAPQFGSTMMKFFGT